MNTVPVSDAEVPVIVSVLPLLPGFGSAVVLPIAACTVELPDGGCVWSTPIGPTLAPTARVEGRPVSVGATARLGATLNVNVVPLAVLGPLLVNSSVPATG